MMAARETLGSWELGPAGGKVLGVEADKDADVVATSVVAPDRFGIIFDRYHAVIWAFLARTAGPDAADELAGASSSQPSQAATATSPLAGSCGRGSMASP